MSGISGTLEHHHVIPINILISKYNIDEDNVESFGDIIFDLNNVVTLLKEEHKLFHSTYGYKSTKEDYEEFVRNYKENINDRK